MGLDVVCSGVLGMRLDMVCNGVLGMRLDVVCNGGLRTRLNVMCNGGLRGGPDLAVWDGGLGKRLGQGWGRMMLQFLMSVHLSLPPA